MSIYTDDVIMFIKSLSEELQAIKSIYWVFGRALSLLCSLSKCAFLPIKCDDGDAALTKAMIDCGE